NGAFDGGSPNIFTPTGSPATVSASTIASNLNTANVTITTGSTGAEAGDITVSSAITWISPYTLLLDAANNIIINAGITGLTGTLQLRAGNLANTITTGASGTINVKNFNLLRGTWSQVSTTLPSFNVSNNFQINSGTMGAANTDAAFIRAANASSTNLGQASNPVELVDIYGLQGAGSTTTTLGYYYVLNNNIDATVTSKWNSGSGFVPMGDYTGTFDGQSHVIQNLYINRPTTVNVGLFSVADNATIQNLGLINPDVTGESQVGPMIGIVFGGTLTNLFSEGGTVRNTSDWSLGGLIGFLWDFVTLSNSYSSTTVIGSGSGDIGGLVGTSGNNTISNTYSTGAVSGPGSIGGLFGTIRSGGSISNSFSTGLVTGSGTPGGLVGAIGAGGATISNSFWDTETSGQSTSAGGTGRTTAQMMTASTFSDAGWSIASSGFTGATPPAGTWLILDGQTRPMLRAEWSTNLNTAHQVQLMSTALDAAYTLTSNVDLSGINNTADIWGGSSSGFIPIGTVSAAFTGSLNGQGYEISNLYINRPSSQYVGLFGLIDDAAASVQNVALTNVNITGLQRVAGLAGRLFTGSISGVSVTGTVTGLDSPVGGIVGDNYGLIDQSYNAASIVGDLQAGGIAGYNYGTISNSYNIGSISGDVSGGLVGVLDAGGTISNSYSSGLVTGSLNTGGLIGVDTGGTVTASYWDTDTSGQLTSDGGTGLTTAQLLDFTTYDTDGWNISSTPSTGTTAPAATWLIFDDATRPMLAAEWSTTVRNAHQLQLMGMALDAEYTLANDIDASSTISSTTYGADVWGGTSGTGFVPVGRTTSAPFTGSLNGNGYVIDNLTITQTLPTLSGLGNFGEVGAGGAGTTPTYVGLFGVATNAIISNIGLTNVSITGGAGGTGGLAGALTGGTSTAAITNAYSIGSVSGSGAVGGLVGINQGLIAQSYSGGLMTGSAVSFATGGLVGYNELASFGVGSGTGYIEDSYSFANVVSNSTRTLGNRSHAGGLVGFNNFSTTTTRSYSFGSVTGTANTNLGGLIGTNNSGTVSNSYWDTQTSGRASSSGGTGRTTSQMMAQATFSGWDFTDVWGVIEGQSYPYLRSFYTSTPRAISGTSSSANSVVNLVVDGSILDSTYTGANGFFYFLEGDNQIGTNNTIADSTGILVYLDNAATQANVVAVTPGSGGSLSGSTQLALTANTVQIGNSASASFSNTLLDTAKGSLSDADILYSVSSNNLTLGNVTNPNVSLATTATTTYNINGNITASGTGALTFNGPVLLSADPTLTTATGNISFNDTLDSSVSARALIINSSGTTTFGGAVGEGSDLLSITANSGGSTVINGGSINTTGTIDISDAITLGADTTINSGNLFFGLTVDSDGNSTPRALTINTGSNQIGLLGDVGNTFALGAITLNSTGTTTLNGTISAASLATNSGGTTQINGGTVTTTGAAGQVYGDNVTINANSIFSANTGPISFAGTLDGFATNWNLTLNTTGATTFSGMVGNGVALGTLDVSGSSIKVNGGLIRTTGTQTYNDPVTINNNNATFTSTSGDINFTDTIDTDIAATGSYALTLNANDVLTLGGKIGTAPLTWGITSLSATANTININGGTDISLNPTIDTLGTQTYTGATVLGADTVLSSLTGNVSFISDATHTSTIDSDNALTPRALTVYFGNDNYFSADIGAGVPLASLTSTPLAATMSIHFQDTLNPANVINVTTVGDQTYGDDVHLD
ncbi:beta strand repeat-containing protein, partial [Aquicella lusitana]